MARKANPLTPILKRVAKLQAKADKLNSEIAAFTKFVEGAAKQSAATAPAKKTPAKKAPASKRGKKAAAKKAPAKKAVAKPRAIKKAVKKAPAKDKALETT
jgi:hypothetical protein